MSPSTKPYIIRALHEWCGDNGLTPYLVVWVNEHVHVPQKYVNNNEILLNIALSATKSLRIDNEWLSFSASFGGVLHDIWVPIANVMSIFARETGEGMGFEVHLEDEKARPPVLRSVSCSDDANPPGISPTPRDRPSLRVVK